MSRYVSLLVIFLFGSCLLVRAQRRDDAVEVAIDDLEPTPVGVSLTLRAASDSRDAGKTIHIMVGFPEGQSIARAIRHEPAERPLVHDLFKAFMQRNGWHVQKVLIRAVKDDTYLADLTLQNDKETQVYDARPSDAMAIALRDDAKIYVTLQVFEHQMQRENNPDEGEPAEDDQPRTLTL